jgi:hypothetical protein
MVDQQIDARLRDHHGEFFQELDPAEYQGAGPVDPRVREGEADAAVAEQLDALVPRDARRITGSGSSVRSGVPPPSAPSGPQRELTRYEIVAQARSCERR